MCVIRSLACGLYFGVYQRSQNHNVMRTGRALLGVLTGFAAGAVLGAVLSSERGSGTRRAVSRKGRELAEALQDEIDLKFGELASRLADQTAQQMNNGDPVDREM